MRIVKVETQGFRGKSEVYKLTGKDIFLGENGVGKTKVQNAITYCLTGRLGESKKNEAIFAEYASDKLMHVSVLFDNQIQITRRLIEKSKKNVVSYETNCFVDYLDTGSVLCTGVKAVNLWIEENLNVPEIILMFHKFDSMKTTSRRELLNEYVPYIEPSHDEIIAYLKASETLEDCDEGYESAFNGAIEKLRDATDLKDMLAMAEKQRAYHLTIKNNDKGAKVTLANMKNQMQESIACQDDLADELVEVHKTIDDLIHEVGKTNGLLLAVEDRKRQIADYNNVLTMEFVDSSKSIQNMIDEYKLELEQLFDKKPKADPRKEDIFAILADIDIRQEELVAEEQKLAEDRAGDFDRLERLDEQMDACSNGQICPVTGLECNGDMQKVVDSLLEERSRVISRLDESQGAVDIVQKRLATTGEKKNIMVKALIELDEKQLALEQEFNDNQGQKIERLQKNLEKYQDRLSQSIESKDFHERNVKYAKDGLAAMAEKPIPQHQPLEKLERRLAVARSRREAIKDELDSIAKKSTTYELQKQSAIMCDLSSFANEAWSNIKKALGVSGLQGELIKQSVGPFTRLMDVTLAKFNRHEHFFLETVNEQGAEVLRFGWIRNGQRINYASLSNGERLINAICMMYAFQKIKNIEFKIIMIDDVEKLDTDNAMAIQTGINALAVDNAILCGRRLGVTIHQNFKVEVMQC